MHVQMQNINDPIYRIVSAFAAEIDQSLYFNEIAKYLRMLRKTVWPVAFAQKTSQYRGGWQISKILYI